jgi:hypothetical protein
MKRTVTAVLSSLLLLSLLAACSEDLPRLRVRNENDRKANVQVKPDVGSTININDVGAGTTTEYRDMSEGRYAFKASIQSGEESNELVQDLQNDTRYELVISDEDPPVLKIVTN